MASKFSDIENHWAKACILALAERNLISGYSDGRFRPDATITRAEFAALIRWAFPEIKATQNPITFADVPAKHWASEVIQFAYQSGFLSGYPNKIFKPEQPIPRVQALVALVNGLKYSSPTNATNLLTKTFQDASAIPRYATEAIAAAINTRLVVNYPNAKQLKPNQNATRAEVVAFLCQALKISVVPLQYIAGLFEIAPQFDNAGSFVKGKAKVYLNNTERYIDRTGKFVAAPPPDTETSTPIAELRPLFSETNNRWGYVNKTGQWIVQPQYEAAGNFKDDVAFILLNNRWGIINQTGKILVEPQFELIEEFSEGLARVVKGGKVGYIDKTGKLVIEPQFSGTSLFPGDAAHILSFRPGGKFSQGLAGVEISQKWGYIDKTGKIIIEPMFEGVGEFSEGLAAVNIGGQWEFMASPSFISGGKWGYIRHPQY